MSNKELKNLQTDLKVTQFSEISSRGLRDKSRSESRNREENSNPDHLDMEGLRISADQSKDEKSVSKLSFSGRESYTIVSKASKEEIHLMDQVTFALGCCS